MHFVHKTKHLPAGCGPAFLQKRGVFLTCFKILAQAAGYNCNTCSQEWHTQGGDIGFGFLVLAEVEVQQREVTTTTL